MSPDLIFSFLSKQTLNLIFSMYGHTLHQVYATNCKRNKQEKEKKKQVSGCCLILPQSCANQLRNKMCFILSWPRREFHRSVTAKMPTRSMVHETASFYWHGIQSVPPGYMSLALQWGPPITALPASYYPIPFYAPPPTHTLPSLHKYNQPCQERHNHLLSSTIVSDWLCRVSLHPSPCLWIPLELARCQEILPHPSHSHPLTS